MSLRVEEGGRELLRVEVLEARASGFAKFRLWYYKWSKTRPDRPYVDVEIRPYRDKGGKIGFRGRVFVKVAEGILREHLVEIADLLKRGGVEGVAYYEYGERAFLHFTGAFRDSVLSKLGVRLELPPGEPPAVEYLGGLKFKAGDREVEFREEIVSGRYEFYAELMFPSEREAERFARSLKAIGVDARVAGSEKDGYAVRLDSDSFFGLLAATGATPPGLTPLYSSKEGDFRVYASMEGGRMRFYFAVKHEGVWRAVEGLYSERQVELIRAEREVLEAIRGAVAKALGHPADVEEPKEKVGERGNIKVYRLLLYGPHLAPFLEHAAETVKAGPAEVRLEGRRIVISAGGIKAEVEFKLLKGSEAEFLLAKDVRETLALYKSLKEVGVRAEITPKGVRVGREALWSLIAAAVERGAPNALPAEVMPGVELLKAYNVGGIRIYAFRVSEEGVHYYFAIKTEEGWRATGGKYDDSSRVVQLTGKAARIVAEAINALYREIGMERKVEVKYHKHKDVPYIKLTNIDLKLLGLM